MVYPGNDKFSCYKSVTATSRNLKNISNRADLTLWLATLGQKLRIAGSELELKLSVRPRCIPAPETIKIVKGFVLQSPSDHHKDVIFKKSPTHNGNYITLLSV